MVEKRRPDKGQYIELGHDHRAYFTAWMPDRDINPQYDGIADVEKFGLVVEHPDKREPWKACAGGITFDTPTAQQLGCKVVWQIVSLEPATLHVEPSLLCLCGDHGFIRNGRWEPC